MSEELQKIVDEYREKEIHISDEEAEQILWLCNRKMDICKIENREEYLPLLFKDEVKNYLFRCSVNATTFLRRLEAEGICVQNPYRHPATIGILDRTRNLRQINLGNDKDQRVPGIRNRDRRLYGTRVKSIH